MTIGPMDAYRQAVHKYSGMKKLTDEAMDHWLDVVLSTLLPRTQQMFVDELFFLTTGLAPMDPDPAPEMNKEEPSYRGGLARRSAISKRKRMPFGFSAAPPTC